MDLVGETMGAVCDVIPDASCRAQPRLELAGLKHRV